jgi:MtN3 and saliva related transmembrane protein
MYVDAIGYAAGSLTAICFLPQIRQTLKTRSAADVSLWMLLLTMLSVILYEIYAALLGLWPVVIMNGIFLVLVGFELFLKMRFSTTLPMNHEANSDLRISEKSNPQDARTPR